MFSSLSHSLNLFRGHVIYCIWIRVEYSGQFSCYDFFARRISTLTHIYCLYLWQEVFPLSYAEQKFDCYGGF